MRRALTALRLEAPTLVCLDIEVRFDAFIRAVIAERGHTAGCLCRDPDGYDDPLCAPPSWLPTVTP
jgi:hypothetical protein